MGRNVRGLNVLLCTFLLILVNGSSLMEKLLVKNQNRKSQLSPEPCYPPPCPGFDPNYRQPAVDDGLVVAEHFGEGDDLTPDTLSPPPTTPNSGNAMSGAPKTDAPAYPATPVATAQTSSNSVIDLGPPPSFFMPPNHIHDVNCEHAKSPELNNDLERIKTVETSVAEKEVNLKVHQVWLEKAHEALDKVTSLVKEEEGNKRAIGFQIEELKLEKQELSRRARRHQLEAALKETKATMEALETQSARLKVTNRLLEKRGTVINNKVNNVMGQLHVTKDKVTEKLEEINKDNRLKDIANQYDAYLRTTI